MLLTIFQGSKPIAASTTPTRMDSRTSRNATVSGEPPRKRARPSLAVGNSLVSFGIGVSRADSQAHSNTEQGRWGTRRLPSMVGGYRLINLARFLRVGRCPPRLKALRLSACAPVFPAG